MLSLLVDWSASSPFPLAGGHRALVGIFPHPSLPQLQLQFPRRDQSLSISSSSSSSNNNSNTNNLKMGSIEQQQQQQKPSEEEEYKKNQQSPLAPPPAPIAKTLEPPEKPLPGDCCGSGCVRCVWDIYYEELEEYNNSLSNSSPNSTTSNQ